MADEERPQRDTQTAERPTPSRGAPAAEKPTPQQEEKSPEEVREQYDERMQKERDEVQRRIDHPQIIGAHVRSAVPPPNVLNPPAGPMSMAWSVKGLKIFQNNGRRYQVVGEMGGGVLATDLESAMPKTVYFMSTPESYEPAPE